MRYLTFRLGTPPSSSKVRYGESLPELHISHHNSVSQVFLSSNPHSRELHVVSCSRYNAMYTGLEVVIASIEELAAVKVRTRVRRNMKPRNKNALYLMH
jgi:hypothetical protein